MTVFTLVNFIDRAIGCRYFDDKGPPLIVCYTNFVDDVVSAFTTCLTSLHAAPVCR